MNIDALIGQGDAGDVVASLCSFEGLKGRMEAEAKALEQTLGEQLVGLWSKVADDYAGAATKAWARGLSLPPLAGLGEEWE